jgi:tetrahydromethanopterin S-methyltransferase subunit G
MKTSYEKFMASSAVAENTNVELGSVKVELASINEIASRVQKAKSEIDNFNGEVAKLQAIARTQSVKGAGIVTALEDILDMYNALSADFKKLGIDPASYKEVKAAKDLYFSYYNGVKQLTQEMKNIL